MPTYTCSKCARVFKRKSGYDDHLAKKTDCIKNTALDAVIEAKVEEKLKDVVRSKTEITKDNLPSFFEDLHNLLWNRAGLNPEKALEHLTFFFAYRLIELQADSLNLPQECRWSYIASLKNEDDLFQTIKKGVSSFRSKAKTKPLFKQHEIQRADVVYDIVQQINRVSIATLQETDTLGDIFEYMLNRGMSTMADEGQYFTNRAICRLAFKIAYDIKKTLRRPDGRLCTFADWFCGTGGFPAEYVKGVNKYTPTIDWKKESNSIYCQDMNLSSVTTTLLNMLILTGVPFSNETIRSSNSFSDPLILGDTSPFKDVTIDYCFMNPPYGGDKTKGKEYRFAYAKKVKDDSGNTTKKYFVNQEIQSIGIEDDDKVSAGVQLAMATLSDEGVCCIVLPQGFFFGASKKAIELRKKIAEEYKIHYVVDIASGAFVNTGTKTSMLVFQRGVGPTEKVKFLDMNENIIGEASLADLRGKNYSLNYKQYLAQEAVEVEGFEMVKLGDICEFYGGQAIKKEDRSENGTVPYYGSNGIVGYMDTHIFEGKYIITGQDGTLGTFYKTNGKFWASNHTHVFRPKPSSSVILEYLYHYLVNNFDFEKVRTGSCIPKITLANIKEVKVAIPSLETQQQIVDAIDGWATLAQHEEEALKMLEKQVMFYVKEMGKGKQRVKLGDVCDIKYGDKNTSYETVELYPGIGGGIAPSSYVSKWNIEAYTPIVSRSGSAGYISRYPTKAFAGSFAFACLTKSDKCSVDYLYFALKNQEEYIKTLPEGTVQKNMNRDVLRGVELQLPSLTEQQTLQADFDEIRHKHEKIAQYKAKADDAIRRLIPNTSA